MVIVENQYVVYYCILTLDKWRSQEFDLGKFWGYTF